MYIIDFGLSKRFYDTVINQHIAYNDRKSLTGTVRYASINAHRGIELTRRDDMISTAYTLLYFARGMSQDPHERIGSGMITVFLDIRRSTSLAGNSRANETREICERYGEESEDTS